MASELALTFLTPGCSSAAARWLASYYFPVRRIQREVSSDKLSVAYIYILQHTEVCNINEGKHPFAEQLTLA